MPEEIQSPSRVIDIMGIQSLLPHRFPLLLVDRILDFEPGVWIRGIKNISMSDQTFQGHFPKSPVFPGVLIVEAMAQTGGCLILQGIENRAQKVIYFMSIDNVKFRKPVVPGDQLVMELKVLSIRGRIAKLRGEAFVAGQKVAEAEFMSMLMDVEEGKAQ